MSKNPNKTSSWNFFFLRGQKCKARKSQEWLFNQFSMKKEEREQNVNITKAAATLRFTVGERFLKSCQSCGAEAVCTQKEIGWSEEGRKFIQMFAHLWACIWKGLGWAWACKDGWACFHTLGDDPRLSKVSAPPPLSRWLLNSLPPSSVWPFIPSVLPSTFKKSEFGIQDVPLLSFSLPPSPLFFFPRAAGFAQTQFKPGCPQRCLLLKVFALWIRPVWRGCPLHFFNAVARASSRLLHLCANARAPAHTWEISSHVHTQKLHCMDTHTRVCVCQSPAWPDQIPWTLWTHIPASRLFFSSSAAPCICMRPRSSCWLLSSNAHLGLNY